MLTEVLHKGRPQEEHPVGRQQQLLRFLLFFLVGALLGFASKYIEGIPHEGRLGDALNLIGNIFSGIGIWTLMATFMAAWSRKPLLAGMNVFLFFVGVLLAYYAYSMKLFGFFPMYYFLRWGVIAIGSIFGAAVVWFGRGKGWMAALCAALPVGLLLEQGWGALSIARGINLIGALLLLMLLPKHKPQIFRILPIALVVAVMLRKLPILSFLLGGL